MWVPQWACQSHLESLHWEAWQKAIPWAQLCPCLTPVQGVKIRWLFRAVGDVTHGPLQIFNKLTFQIIWINQSDRGTLSCWVGEMIIESERHIFILLLMSKISKNWKGSGMLCGRNLLRKRTASGISVLPEINWCRNVSKLFIMCTLKTRYVEYTLSLKTRESWFVNLNPGIQAFSVTWISESSFP